MTNQECDACNRKTDTPWVCFDIHMTCYNVCEGCVTEVASTCTACEMTLTHECYEDNENVCIFCLQEEDDPDYEPSPYDGETDSDTDSDDLDSDACTDDDDDE